VAMRRRGERGETLAEVLVSTTLLGIIGIGIIGAIASALISTDIDRKTSRSETILRSYVAAVQDLPYQPDGAYGTAGFTPPERFTVKIASAACWTGNHPTVVPLGTRTTFAFAGCPGAGTLQKLELEVASTDGRSTETVTIFKRKTDPA
jgi:hypothetical protein